MKEQVNIIVDPEKIELLSIRVLAANFFIAPECVDTHVGGYQLEYQVDNGINVEEKAIRMVIDGKFQAVDDNQIVMNVRGELSAEFIFNISDLERFLLAEEDKTGMPMIYHGLNMTLMSIAFSTYRGIVFTRTQGTFKDPIILPVINPQKLLNRATTIGNEQDTGK
jgi:hypothetical protein